MLSNSGMSSSNYNKLLVAWSQQSIINPNVSLGADNISYTAIQANNAHLILTGSPNNWIITDNGYQPFNGDIYDENDLTTFLEGDTTIGIIMSSSIEIREPLIANNNVKYLTTNEFCKLIKL